MKKKFENPPRRRVYVFTDYKWLYRLVKVLYRFFLSRLEGLNKRLEEVKIKAYGVVKDMYELFMAYVDTLSRWLRRVKFVGSVLVYPD
jgi:deoxyribodipyrimidine photolyase